MDDSPKPISTLVWLLPTTLIVVLVVAGVGMFRFLKVDGPPGEQGGGKPVVRKLTREESMDLLSIRDRAVGHLENQEFDEAERLLLEIIRLVPGDPFGLRNLTICRELAVEKLDPGRDAAKLPLAMKKAQDAAEKLSLIEPDSHVPHVLLARLALKEGNPDRAAAALRRATEIAPKSAPVWYDLFVLKPISPGEPPAKETVDALRKVYELEPDNLFVLKDWLPLQAQLKDPSLGDTIAKAKETLVPFADVIKMNIRIDIRDMLDKLAKAVDGGQWQVATSTSMTIRNVIVSEAARDERYVRLNSMEYLLLDFGSSFYQHADLPEHSNPGVPVKFVSRKTGLPNGALDVVCADFNLDGLLDCAALYGHEFFINLPIEPPGNLVGMGIGEGLHRFLAVDLDDDVDPRLKDRPKDAVNCPMADPDLIFFGPAGIKLFETHRQADTIEFRIKAVGDALDALRDVTTVVPGDLDLDGDLDFVTISSTGVQMWSNRGNWSFEEITSRSKLPPANFGPITGAVVDWDQDTDLDVLIAGAEGIGILENMHHGRFRWRNLDGDFAKLAGSKSLLVEQWGSRPSWSVVGAGRTGVHVVLTDSTAAGVVSPQSVVRVVESNAEKVLSLDYDNDGVRDLLVVDSKHATVWRGLPNGTFEALSRDAGGELKDVTAIAIGDIDRDGDEDLLLGSTGEWAANDGGNANGWLDVALVAQQIKPNEQNYSKRVNHSGIGSTIEIKTGSRYQAQVVRGSLTHFGLGKQKQADVLRVLWTNGIPQNYVSPAANQLICEDQKLHGSCPYLYAWNGQEFVFCTDLLWNAPLGLKFAEDVVAPWREWEYLKVDGDKLRAKDGLYQLRVTAELWEIEYFDEIKLFAVDHPAGTQIFTNEKVGPASIAEHKIHTVFKPHLPVAARDIRGRDILDQVQARDGIFTKTFDRKLAQGLTTEHFLELDLGEWTSRESNEPKPEPTRDTNRKRERGSDESNRASPVVTLFLTGWMYPGSTSLSVQHSQNPDQARQRPPSLQAVDANGHWREVRPFMGFPGGKTKTIAVDISDVFPSDSTDHRLRIVTNMEFYWDAAFFTVDDHPVEFHQAELPLVTASLKDRGGVSHREWPATGNGPELFDYQQLVPGDSWPPIAGKFTRFGDVRPLLTTRDDHLVVMHPGDEIQLAFAAPSEPLPEGWVRDVVICNIGWDKDCDQNTVYGESSEPLPFRDMTDYPLRNGEARPMDDDYVRYLKTYQTRPRSRAPFWNEIARKR